MLIGEVMDQLPEMTAAENMANRLADRVRNIWLENREAGKKQWEVNFFEDADGIAFLRSEAFPDLQGIDYIFQWWDHDDTEGLAGQLEVLWKVRDCARVKIFKTVIRFADRDFIRGNIRDERKKREANRAEFRGAFALWQKLYQEQIGQ